MSTRTPPETPEGTDPRNQDAAAFQPVEVRRIPDERRLAIRWQDGAETIYDYSMLRGYCPCAGCQGHMVRDVVYKPPRTPVDLFLIEPVGHYALSFLFSDGHHTGIYRFEYLRTLGERDRRRREREASDDTP